MKDVRDTVALQIGRLVLSNTEQAAQIADLKALAAKQKEELDRLKAGQEGKDDADAR